MDCSVGAHCKLETNAYITAYSRLEDFVFIAPGVITSNDNFAGRTKDRAKYYKGITVLRGGRVGAGATILPGKTIEADAMLAAGSVLTRDIPARELVGRRARPLSAYGTGKSMAGEPVRQ